MEDATVWPVADDGGIAVMPAEWGWQANGWTHHAVNNFEARSLVRSRLGRCLSSWVRGVLSAGISRLADDLTDLIAASRDSNADDEHDPEGQTIAYERSQLLAVTSQARDHMREIGAALECLAAGAYGVCEVCRSPIDAARLEGQTDRNGLRPTRACSRSRTSSERPSAHRAASLRSRDPGPETRDPGRRSVPDRAGTADLT